MPWRRVLRVSFERGSALLDRRERRMRVLWSIGAEIEPGRAEMEEKSEEGGREEMAERIWGVVVRRTIA